MKKACSLGVALAIVSAAGLTGWARQAPDSPKAKDEPSKGARPGVPPREGRAAEESNDRPAARRLSPEEKAQRDEARARRQQEVDSGEPDVLLDIPNLSVEEITLDVQDLEAHVALDARLANLLSLSAGADVSIESVNLTIKGVQAEALLKVRLHNVAQIIDRTLQTIDNNPEIIVRLLESVDKTVGTVGDVADKAVGTVGDVAKEALKPGGLLSQTVNALDQTVQRVLEPTGKILERTLDAAGKVVDEKTVANLAEADLPVVKEATNAAGQAVRRVRDELGAVIEYTEGEAGKITNARVIQPGRKQQRPRPDEPKDDQEDETKSSPR